MRNQVGMSKGLLVAQAALLLLSAVGCGPDRPKTIPISGSFDQSGVYRVMSWEPDDGLVPGNYTVNI